MHFNLKCMLFLNMTNDAIKNQCINKIQPNDSQNLQGGHLIFIRICRRACLRMSLQPASSGIHKVAEIQTETSTWVDV